MEKTVTMNEFNFSARRTILSLFSRKELRELAKETGTKIGRDKCDTIWNLLAEHPPIIVKIDIIAL